MMNLLDKYIEKFFPKRNKGDWPIEDPKNYAKRIKIEYLPHFPESVLVDWFYRHWNNLDSYAWLGYETLRFELQEWELGKTPGREIFADETICDGFSGNFEERVSGPHDWLAKYMNVHGTWNKPIILFDNKSNLISPWKVKLKNRFIS